MTIRRVALSLVLAGVVFGATAGTASGHAAFVSSDPEPGQRLQTAPGAVQLRFSEPLNSRLSLATVIDPSGRAFRSSQASDREVRVQLRTNTPGEYEVRWTTVSPLDGHSLHGAFRFGVGVTPSGGDASTDLGPRATDITLAVARGIEYGGLLTLTGMLLLLLLARRQPPLMWVHPRTRLTAAVALLGGAAVISGEVIVATSSLSLGAFDAYLTTGAAGWARLFRLGAEAVALAAVVRGRRWLAAVSVAAALIAVAAAGHAAALRPAWFSVGLGAVHLMSAGLWAGGIAALATLRPPDGWRDAAGRTLLDRYSRVAINAFALTVATGYFRSTQELSTPSDLWASSYGRVLGLKVLVVLTMVPLSVRAWQRVVGSVRGEAVLAAGVVLLAALLVAYPLPPARTAEAEDDEVSAPSPISDGALPRDGDVTFGEAAGDTLVGLTIRPGLPGRNEVTIFLLPTDETQDVADVAVELSVAGRDAAVRSCGSRCRGAVVSLEGDERIGVHVGGPEGGDATVDLDGLPAARGDRLVREATVRMGQLETLQVDERLHPGDPPIRNEFTFKSPDRMRLHAVGRFESVSIGRTHYQRSVRSDEWTVRRDSAPVDAPLLTWSGFDLTAPNVVGQERVEGVPSQIVSFFTGTPDNPIWFRLWIGEDELVRRMQMNAYAHFMTQRLYGFDRPVEINAPR